MSLARLLFDVSREAITRCGLCFKLHGLLQRQVQNRRRGVSWLLSGGRACQEYSEKVPPDRGFGVPGKHGPPTFPGLGGKRSQRYRRNRRTGDSLLHCKERTRLSSCPSAILACDLQ